MRKIVRTINQKRLRIVAIIALLVSIYMVLGGLLFFTLTGLLSVSELQEMIVEEGIVANSAEVSELSSIFVRRAGYYLLVGLSLQIAAIYGIRASRNAVVAVRMRKATAVTVSASILGLLWTGWSSLTVYPSLLVGYLLCLVTEIGMLQLGRFIQGEVTGEMAKAVERERIRKSLPREERLADQSRLGFLRVIQVMFSLNIFFTIVSLVFSSRNGFSYGYRTLYDWANIVFQCVAFYLLYNRTRTAKRWVIGYSAFNILANIARAIYLVSTAKESVGSAMGVLAINSFFDIVIIVYFLRSDRVRILMTNELSREVADDALEEMRHGKPFLRNLLLYYCIFSTLGHWMEAAFCQLVALGLFEGDIDFGNTMLFRDWLYPFPMHGIAVVLVALILWPLKNALARRFNRWVTLALSFLINMLFCTGIEFTGGMLFNRNLQLWNYTDIPFNFMGQICLQNAIGFGLAATVIVYIVYPNLERYIARVPADIMNVVSVGIFAFYAILTALYVIDFSPEAAAANAASIILLRPYLPRIGLLR